MRTIHSHPHQEARNGVFISYSRRDGKAFATALRERLKANNISVWQDLSDMEGGRSWWLQIENALANVEFMVLVVTPAALNSEVIRKEWHYARQQGVCVYPVKGTSELDEDSLPRWIRKVHYYDIGSPSNSFEGIEGKKFLRHLNAPCTSQKVPIMAEDLPYGYVERSTEFTRLITTLLDPSREEPLAITAALCSVGGYGKTTLAAAICRNEEIQNAFDDGILWITLGEELSDAGLIGRVEDLIYRLDGKRSGSTTIEAAKMKLALHLGEKDILMVVDDVWYSAHLDPFIHGGSKCARLITTRMRDTLPREAIRIDVDAMQPKEAVDLLSAGLPEKDNAIGALDTLANRLGRWPQVLGMVNGVLRKRVSDGEALNDALHFVTKDFNDNGLTTFDPNNEKDRKRAVKLTLDLSFKYLDDEKLCRFFELAIFPENEDVPLNTVHKLWGKSGYNETKTDKLCGELLDLSLLRNRDLKTKTIRLNDVIQIYLIGQQVERLPSIHKKLLDVYRSPSVRMSVWSQLYGFLSKLSYRRKFHPVWADLPSDEQYLWKHLAHHLAGAEHYQELITTVKNWHYLKRKTCLGHSFGVESDISKARDYSPNDYTLRRLQRAFKNSSRLFYGKTKDEIEFKLNARLQHLKDCLNLPPNSDLVSAFNSPYIAVRVDFPELLPSTQNHYENDQVNITCCRFYRKRNRFVSASTYGTLGVWDTLKGRLLFSLEGHKGSVNHCVFSADGKHIVSASSDCTLKFWDFKADKLEYKHTLKGHDAAVKGCAFSKDGNLITSVSSDGTLIVWDASDGSLLQKLKLKVPSSNDGDEDTERDKDTVNDYAFSPDGRWIVSASDDGDLKAWYVGSGRPEHTLTHSGQVRCCAFSQCGNYLASGSADHTLRIWDAKNWKSFLVPSGEMDKSDSSSDGQMEKMPWEGRHEDVVNDCAFSPDGKLVVSASSDGTFKVWEVASAKCIATFYDEGEMFCCLMDDEMIYGGGERGVYFLELIGKDWLQGRAP